MIDGRAFELTVARLRTVPVQADALDAYAATELPPGPVPPLLEQGFVAGYDAAMTAVRKALNEAQTRQLREGSVG